MCFVSATLGTCWKLPMIKESSSYTSGERGVLNLHPVFTAWKEKKQPSLNSLFWLFNSMLWSECKSTECLVNNRNTCGSQINPQSHTGLRCGISYESRNNFLFPPKIKLAIHNKGLEGTIVPGLQRESKEVQIMRETQSDSGTNLFLFSPSLKYYSLLFLHWDTVCLEIKLLSPELKYSP